VSDGGGKRRGGAMRSFVVGSAIGVAAAVVAAPRLRRGRRPDAGGRVAGLEAFEGAPCWHHDRAQARDDDGR
jgi:cell division septation protein DedD